MTDSAPRVSPRLVAAIERLDDGKVTLAELCRRVGAEADRLGLSRPSYERVRTLAHELRALRAEPSLGSVLWDVMWRVEPPEAILRHLSGPDDPK